MKPARLILLNPVFGPGCGFCLPLHVRGGIGTVSLQGNDVVNHHSFARSDALACYGAWMSSLEIMYRERVAFDSAVTIPHAGAAFGRARNWRSKTNSRQNQSDEHKTHGNYSRSKATGPKTGTPRDWKGFTTRIPEMS